MMNEEIKNTIKMCRFCYMCRHSCPVFLTTKLDSNTPRGYAMLLSRVYEGITELSPNLAQKLYECTQCGLCKELCEFHWAEDEIVRSGREYVVEKGMVPQNVLSGLEAAAAEYSLPVKNSDLVEKVGARVLYYGGREVAQRETTLRAVEKIFEAAGESYTVLSAELPTGVELYELGYTEQAKETARRFAEKTASLGVGLVVTSCAHAYKFLKLTLPELGLESAPQVQHIAEYIDEAMNNGVLSLSEVESGGVVAYHDPCQLAKGCNVYDAPRRIISAALGHAPVELFHSKGEAECCGAGSVMYLTDPELSNKIAQRRVDGAVTDGVAEIVTACANCAAAFDRTGRVKVTPIEELVAKSLCSC